MWKDGKKISSNYGFCSLESLAEGSTVGLMRKSSCLHVYIDGTDQGVADSFLPPGHVYPIVDLYGRCTRVSIIQPSELSWQQYDVLTTVKCLLNYALLPNYTCIMKCTQYAGLGYFFI